jgi:hypothetical protein
MMVTERTPRLASSGPVRGSEAVEFYQQLQPLILKIQIGVALVGGAG